MLLLSHLMNYASEEMAEPTGQNTQIAVEKVKAYEIELHFLDYFCRLRNK